MDDYFMWWGPGGLLEPPAPTFRKLEDVTYLGGGRLWSPANDPPTVGLYFPENARYMMLGAAAEEVAK